MIFVRQKESGIKLGFWWRDRAIILNFVTEVPVGVWNFYIKSWNYISTFLPVNFTSFKSEIGKESNQEVFCIKFHYGTFKMFIFFFFFGNLSTFSKFPTIFLKFHVATVNLGLSWFDSIRFVNNNCLILNLLIFLYTMNIASSNEIQKYKLQIKLLFIQIQNSQTNQ